MQAKSNKGNKESIHDLCKWSRILKINDSQENIPDYNKEVYATNGNEDLLPIEIGAELLENHRIIDCLNIANGEVLVYEVKLNYEDDASLPFCLKPVIKAPATKKPKSNTDKFNEMNKPQQQKEEEEKEKMKEDLSQYLKPSK